MRDAVARRIRGRFQGCGENRGIIKKHGEVAFPTQVRYDIVFLIRPLIVILALRYIVQATCHLGKIPKKHQLVHILTGFGPQASGWVLRICTLVLRKFTTE